MTAFKPLVSVVVAVYNVEKYLVRCINSLRSQTYSNIEVVLVDDGSTDDSGTICDEFHKKSSLITVVHKANGGLSDARNVGLSVAEGKYVVFVDGDDLVAPCYVEHLMLPILNGNADFAICDLMETSNPDSLLSINGKAAESVLYSPGGALIECLKGEVLTVSACGKLGKRSLWMSHPFPTGQVYEDLFTVPYLISQAGNVAHIPEALYGQVMRDGSITRAKSITEKQYCDYHDAIKRNETLFAKSENAEVRSALAVRIMIENARLLRLFHQIRDTGTMSEKILNEARDVLRAALSNGDVAKAPMRVKASVILGLFSPELQSGLFRIYQKYKAARVLRK